MNEIDDPRFKFLVSLGFVFIGFLMLKHREAIGGMTDVWIPHGFVTARTPGCFLIPFALLFILAGVGGIVLSLIQLLAS